MAETVRECLGDDLDLASIALVVCESAEVSCFPFEEDGRVGLGLEKDDENEDQTRDDECYPFSPAPGHERRFANESTDNGTEDGTHEGGIRKDGESVDALHGRPQIRD